MAKRNSTAKTLDVLKAAAESNSLSVDNSAPEGNLVSYLANRAAADFKATGNALHALSAIAFWPPDQPFPPIIASYLREACLDIRAIAGDFVDGKLNKDAANAAVLSAIGITGTKKKGSNAFAEMRERDRAIYAAVAKHRGKEWGQ